MKINIFTLLLTLFLAVLSACQKEITEIIEPPTDEAFTPESPVSDLILRTSFKDGSFDNIVDKSSCTTLQLPVTVIVNGIEVELNTGDDLSLVEHIIDEQDDDSDEIDIIFPVTVILADYSEIQITNEDDFEDLVDQCVEGGDDDDIECVDFGFPLEVSVYDSENQLSDVVTIRDDHEMHDFIHNMKEGEFASLNFPITIVLSDGSEMQIHDNDELEDILKNAIDDCDEDDDNDHNDDDIDDSTLVSVLLEGNWRISYFFNNEDEAVDFSGYVFTFLDGGVVKVQKESVVANGSWSSNGDDGILELELDFDGSSPLDVLDEKWDVLSFTGSQIELVDEIGGEGEEDKLTFEKI